MHSLTASYSGDTVNSSSTSNTLAETVNPAGVLPTTLVLSASPDYVTSGTPVAMTAVITGQSPTGNVAFKDGSVTLATVALSAGQAITTQTFTVAGQHSITASYVGDANNQPSVSNTVPVQVDLATTGAPGNMTWLEAS